MCRTGAAPPTHEHEHVLRPGTTPAPARRPPVRVLPRERWGVLRGPPMAMRTGVGLGTDGESSVERRVSDETRVGSGEAAVKGSGGLSVLSRDTDGRLLTGTGDEPHRARRCRAAAAVRAPSTRMRDGCQRLEYRNVSFLFLHSKD